jgi:hypothetical protein
MRSSEPWAPMERKEWKGVVVAAGYLDVPAWRARRLAVVEVLEVQKTVQGNQSRGEHGSQRGLLVTDQRNHAFSRTEKD